MVDFSLTGITKYGLTAKKRFSVRDYTDQKVEPEKLNKILEAAHVAPTAANLQLDGNIDEAMNRFNS